ncbi:hypothetical protein ACJX0J_036152, partial [Zea mays]
SFGQRICGLDQNESDNDGHTTLFWTGKKTLMRYAPIFVMHFIIHVKFLQEQLD